jgi:membrane protein
VQAGQLTPYLLVIAAFTFIYVFIPNTRVRFVPALAGGVVGGILWQSAGWAFATFVASSTNYAAIYSGFAILILFMLWLYLSWLILLFGASVSFYVQHQEYLEARGGELRLSSRMRERLALMIMSLIARRHRVGETPWTVDALSQTLRMPIRMVDSLLSELQEHGFLAPTADEPTGWLPVREPARVSAKDILDAVRTTGEDRYLNPKVLHASEEIESLIRRCDEAAEVACGDVSIEKLGGD